MASFPSTRVAPSVTDATAKQQATKAPAKQQVRKAAAKQQVGKVTAKRQDTKVSAKQQVTKAPAEQQVRKVAAKQQVKQQVMKATLPRQVTKATLKQQMLKKLVCSDAPEQALRYRGYRVIAGIDEVGRGALFGPVVAAAVILPSRMNALARAGLKDSKQLTREERERLNRRIRRMALCVSVVEVDADTIDRVNIYQATRQAMARAAEGLSVCPDHLLIDAMRLDHPCAQTRLFYGDALSLSIAAASVVAKVHRDALMRELDRVHPVYGLASHKGYATPEHRRALRAHGPSPLHRRSFRPVWESDPNRSAVDCVDLVDPVDGVGLSDPLDAQAVLEDRLSVEMLFEDADLEMSTEENEWG